MAAGSPYLRVTYAETNRILPEPYQRVLVAAIAVAALVLPMVGSAYVIYLLNLTFLAIIGAVGLNLLTGYCGQVSLGHASFLAIGAFVTAILSNRYGAPVWLALPAACLVGAAVGFVVGLPSLRFRGIYLAITTLAMHYAIIFVLTTYQANFGSSATAGISVPAPGIGGYEINGGRAWYYMLLLVSAGVVVFALNLSRGYIGRAWVAIRDRDIAAASVRHQRRALQAAGLRVQRHAGGAGGQPRRLLHRRRHGRGLYARACHHLPGDDHRRRHGLDRRSACWARCS